MSFDESGYILYPRASQTQQVPAYDFQVSIPGWRPSVPKYPSLVPRENRNCPLFANSAMKNNCDDRQQIALVVQQKLPVQTWLRTLGSTADRSKSV